MHALKLTDLRTFNDEKVLTWVVSALAFLFPLVVLTVNRADSVILLLLGAIGVYAFLKYGVRGLKLGRQELLLMAMFAGWYAVIVLCYFTGDKTADGFKLMGRCLRLLFFIPAFIACRQYLKHSRLLFTGLVLAPFLSAGLALWQYFHAYGYIRTSGTAEIIPFGDFALAMGFMASASLFIIEARWKKTCYLLAGASLLAGILASFLSGTRGGWIALPILAIVTIFGLSETSWRRAIKIFFVCFVIILVAVLLTPGTIIQNRIWQMTSNIINYNHYLALLNNGDINRQGCLNDKLFLDNLVRQIKTRNISNLDISVIDDVNNLKKSGFRKTCQSGFVVRAANVSKQKNLTFRIARDPLHEGGSQTIRFIVRGQGKVSLIYGFGNNPVWQEIDSANYHIVSHTEKIKTLAWVDFRLLAGETLYFVAMQSSNGEYIFPFADDSVGGRFEMWRAAWHIFRQYPLLGAGTGSFRKELDRWVRMGDVSPKVLSYDHPHNDYLNALSSWGLLGLLLYLLTMIYPLRIFVRSLLSGEVSRKAAGFAGVIMISGLLIFGLTETMFTHSIVMSWYVTFMAMLMAVIYRHKTTGIPNDPA